MLVIYRFLKNDKHDSQPVIAQLVERRTVEVKTPLAILRSLVRIRLAGIFLKAEGTQYVIFFLNVFKRYSVFLWNKRCDMLSMIVSELVECKVVTKVVRSGIWTHAHIRGPEHSYLQIWRRNDAIPWVWRLRPLGHPDHDNSKRCFPLHMFSRYKETMKLPKWKWQEICTLL